jgi:hypothetical protein
MMMRSRIVATGRLMPGKLRTPCAAMVSRVQLDSPIRELQTSARDIKATLEI